MHIFRPTLRVLLVLTYFLFVSAIRLMADPSGDFEYSVSSGKITITNYIGAGGDVVVPARIDNMPVIRIGANAFDTKKTITRVTLPDGLEEIGGWAFFNCSQLTQINIPDSVKNIGDASFQRCTLLSEINLPKGLTRISNWMFEKCQSLTTITLPDTVTVIGDSAFSNCKKLETIDLPSGLTTIESWAFSYCSKLETLLLPEGLTSIGMWSFYNCTSLSFVLLPSTLSQIDVNVFRDCINLAKVYFSGNAPSAEESIFNGALNVVVYYIDGNSGWPVVPAEWLDRPTAHIYDPVVISPNSGAYEWPDLVVQVSCTTPGVSFRWTVNGKDPQKTDPVIPASGKVRVSLPCTFKVRAWLFDGLAPSKVATASYTALLADDGSVPVFRFYSSGAPESTHTHLWTINEVERDVLKTWDSWHYEGIAWRALTSEETGTVPLYRLYEPNIRRHLYTINTTEYVALDQGSWQGEGVQYYVYPSELASGVVPVFRFYHAENRNHHFTIDTNEKNTIIATPEWGYAYEGVAFYVFPEQVTNRKMTGLNESGFVDEELGMLSELSGDFDGDGVMDTAIYDEQTGEWYIRSGAGELLMSGEIWGGPGYVALVAAYSIAGVSDIAVYHLTTGEWYIRTLDGKILVDGEKYGGAGYLPIPFDEDGDGINELCVYSRETGELFVK